MGSTGDLAGGRTLSRKQRMRLEREQEKILASEIELQRQRIDRMRASLQMLLWERQHTQAKMQLLIHKRKQMKEQDSLKTYAVDRGAEERGRLGQIIEDEVERPFPPFLSIERPYGYPAFPTPREAKEDKLKERYERTVRGPQRRSRTLSRAGSRAASAHSVPHSPLVRSEGASSAPGRSPGSPRSSRGRASPNSTGAAPAPSGAQRAT